jgi:ribosome-binding factor A
MAQENARSRRVAEELRRILSELVRREIKDPRVRDVTITEIEVARDLSHASVFYTPLDPDADLEAIQQGLQRAAGFMRSKLAKRMSTRTVPKLNFKYDTSIEQGDRMGRLLRELNIQPADPDDSEDDDGGERG